VKLVSISVKLDSLTFVQFRNYFDKALPKEKLKRRALIGEINYCNNYQSVDSSILSFKYGVFSTFLLLTPFHKI